MEQAPVVSVDALETFVELLTRSDDGSSDTFYSNLCEAICRLASMDRALIFRYDEPLRRVRAAGSYGVELAHFTGSHFTIASAPIARQALVEDRVIEMDSAIVAGEVPERFRDLLGGATLVCCPVSAGGRWSGVVLTDRRGGRLTAEESNLLWTLCKSAALAEAARHATFQGARARQLQERIDLAREVHEGVIQRLFGVLLVVSSDAPLPAEARERMTSELQTALRDLRRALQRPLGRSTPDTGATIEDEVTRLREAHPDIEIELERRSAVPNGLEPLVQSVLVEAVRNARKHSDPTRIDVVLRRKDGAFVMEVANDGLRLRRRSRGAGMGLQLAVSEALQVGGLVEFGEREPGIWQVRLAVPDAEH